MVVYQSEWKESASTCLVKGMECTIETSLRFLGVGFNIKALPVNGRSICQGFREILSWTCTPFLLLAIVSSKFIDGATTLFFHSPNSTQRPV